MQEIDLRLKSCQLKGESLPRVSTWPILLLSLRERVWEVRLLYIPRLKGETPRTRRVNLYIPGLKREIGGTRTGD